MRPDDDEFSVPFCDKSPCPICDAPPVWKRLAAMWSAEQAEHAHVAGYELTAFVIAADPARGWAHEIGWEVHGGPRLLDLVATGQADSFEDAKAQAVAAWHEIADAPPMQQGDLEPTKDDEIGMAWWNGLTDRERAKWAALAGTGRAKDAWERFKRGEGGTPSA